MHRVDVLSERDKYPNKVKQDRISFAVSKIQNLQMLNTTTTTNP
jgi:hypothetical protein